MVASSWLDSLEPPAWDSAHSLSTQQIATPPRLPQTRKSSGAGAVQRALASSQQSASRVPRAVQRRHSARALLLTSVRPINARLCLLVLQHSYFCSSFKSFHPVFLPFCHVLQFLPHHLPRPSHPHPHHSLWHVHHL